MVEDPALRTIDVVIAVKRRAEELGLPEDAPIDLKIFTPRNSKNSWNAAFIKKPSG